MIKFGRYNDLPKELLNSIPKVPKGKRVRFSVDIKRKKDGTVIMPAALGVRPVDRIMFKGESFEIANINRIKTTENGEVPDFESPFFYKDQAGQILLDPNKRPKDRDLYEYLWLCNENASNPNRDDSVPARYHFVDDIKDAKTRTQKVIERSMASQAVFNMPDKDLFAYCAMVGINTNRETDVIRADAIEVAEKDPKRFHEISTYLKQMGPYVADINAAIQEKVIVLNTANYEWQWVDSKQGFFQGFSTMTKTENVKRLAEWLKKDKDGKKIHLSIIEALRPNEDEGK